MLNFTQQYFIIDGTWGVSEKMLYSLQNRENICILLDVAAKPTLSLDSLLKRVLITNTVSHHLVGWSEGEFFSFVRMFVLISW